MQSLLRLIVSLLVVVAWAACGDKPAADPARAAELAPAAATSEPAPSAPAPVPANLEPAAPTAAPKPSATNEATPERPAKSNTAAHSDKPARTAAATSQGQHDTPSAPAPTPATSPAPVAPAPVAPVAPAPVAAAPSGAAAACGEKGQPRCPLQAWMEDHLQSVLDKKDAPALAKGLTRAASFVPDPSWNTGAQGWGALANAGADAAKSGDIAATQATCKSCHKAWRSKYKQMFRTRAIAD